MPVTTKKLPVSLSGRGEFVVPIPQERQNDAFLGIDSGTEFEMAALSFIGREISAEDIAEKFLNNLNSRVPRAELINYFALFLLELQAFKIGNILRIKYLPDGGFKLSCVAKSPTRGRRKKLPV